MPRASLVSASSRESPGSWLCPTTLSRSRASRLRVLVRVPVVVVVVVVVAGMVRHLSLSRAWDEEQAPTPGRQASIAWPAVTSSANRTLASSPFAHHLRSGPPGLVRPVSWPRGRTHARPGPDARGVDDTMAGGPEVRAVRRRILSDGLAIVLSLFAFGMVFGLAARQADFSMVEALSMSLIAYSGAAQFAAVGLVGERRAVAGHRPPHRAAQRAPHALCRLTGALVRRDLPTPPRRRGPLPDRRGLRAARCQASERSRGWTCRRMPSQPRSPSRRGCSRPPSATRAVSCCPNRVPWAWTSCSPPPWPAWRSRW